MPHAEVPDAAKLGPGVGIRISGGDNRPQDLIEITLEVTVPEPPAGHAYILTNSSSAGRVWVESARTGEVPLQTPLPFPPSVYRLTLWVESVNGDPFDVEFVLRDTVNQTTLDSDKVRFYAFRSIIIAFSGETFGSGDITQSGIMTMANRLVGAGYDVHYWPPNAAREGAGTAPYEEVKRAVARRGVGKVAIFGHSHGGGATYQLPNALNANRSDIGNPFVITCTAYVDAIQNTAVGNTAAETRHPPPPPPSAPRHVNYYQRPSIPIGFLFGDAVEGAAVNLNVRQQWWGANVGHMEIDDRPEVISLVCEELSANVGSR